MSKTFLILFITTIGLTAFGQRKADKLFSTGLQLYEANDFAGAITCFKEVVLNYRSFKYYNQSIYNLAYAYNQLEDSLDLAIFWYEKIRSSDLKDDERIGGRGILEPFSNYKHYSTFNIANIEYNRGNLEKALDYYKQCLTKYPFYNESGTDLRINKNRLTIYIADCYFGLKEYEAALMTIVPEALDSDGSANYESVVKSAISLIETNFDKKQLVIELEAAFNTLVQVDGIYEYSFIWHDRTIKLSPYLPSSNTVGSFIEEIKKTNFWIQLTN